jgi:hypothetical protein
LSLGAGIRWKSISIDYAFSQSTQSGNSANRSFFSFKLDL